MPRISKIQEAIAATDALVEYAASGIDLPCYGLYGKESCIRHLDVDYGEQLEPRKVNALCPACSAYWHLQMARNELSKCAREAK